MKRHGGRVETYGQDITGGRWLGGTDRANRFTYIRATLSLIPLLNS